MSGNIVKAKIREWMEKESTLADDAKPITPGMLVEYTTGGLQPHSSAAGALVPLMVATELPQRLGSGIDDPYNVQDEVVEYYFPLPGDELRMLLSTGENVSVGDTLNSNGDGSLQAGSSNALFRALEDVDNSAGYVPARILVEVL